MTGNQVISWSKSIRFNSGSKFFTTQSALPLCLRRSKKLSTEACCALRRIRWYIQVCDAQAEGSGRTLPSSAHTACCPSAEGTSRTGSLGPDIKQVSWPLDQRLGLQEQVLSHHNELTLFVNTGGLYCLQSTVLYRLKQALNLTFFVSLVIV